MGVITDLYAFDTADFEALRKGRRIRALANALVSGGDPPIEIAELKSLDKVLFDHFALLLDVGVRRHLTAEKLDARFFLHGCARISHPHAQIGYWDPFYAVEAFDNLDTIIDRLMKAAKRKVIRRVGGALIKQPGDPFKTEVWAYKKADLATVFGVMRAVLERVKLEPMSTQPVTMETLIDAFFTFFTFLHRAFEPLTPAGRRGKPWTIVVTVR